MSKCFIKHDIDDVFKEFKCYLQIKCIFRLFENMYYIFHIKGTKSCIGTFQICVQIFLHYYVKMVMLL